MAKEEKTKAQEVQFSVKGNTTFEAVAIGDNNQIASKVKTQENFTQAGKDAILTINKPVSTQQGMSLEDVLKLFKQLHKAVNKMEEVPSTVRIDAKAEVEKAMVEIKESKEKGKEPDKKTIAEHLKNATETLKAAGAAAIGATTFGKLVAQAIDWLGANYPWPL